ncbi:unnamed protein product, partial [Prorocentrum cordatum]
MGSLPDDNMCIYCDRGHAVTFHIPDATLECGMGTMCDTCCRKASINCIEHIDRKRLARFLAAARVAGRPGDFYDIFPVDGAELGELLARWLVAATATFQNVRSGGRRVPLSPVAEGKVTRSPVTEDGAAVAAPEFDDARGWGGSYVASVIEAAESEREAASLGHGFVDDGHWTQWWGSARDRVLMHARQRTLDAEQRLQEAQPAWHNAVHIEFMHRACVRAPAAQGRMVAAARLAVVDDAMTAAGAEEWETYEFDTYEAARGILATMTNGPHNPVSRYYERQLSLLSRYHQVALLYSDFCASFSQRAVLRTWLALHQRHHPRDLYIHKHQEHLQGLGVARAELWQRAEQVREQDRKQRRLRAMNFVLVPPTSIDCCVSLLPPPKIPWWTDHLE